MRCPSGIFFSKALFVVVNQVLIVLCARDMAVEERGKMFLREVRSLTH